MRLACLPFLKVPSFSFFFPALRRSGRSFRWRRARGGRSCARSPSTSSPSPAWCGRSTSSSTERRRKSDKVSTGSERQTHASTFVVCGTRFAVLRCRFCTSRHPFSPDLHPSALHSYMNRQICITEVLIFGVKPVKFCPARIEKLVGVIRSHRGSVSIKECSWVCLENL